MSQIDDAVADRFEVSSIDANVRGGPIVMVVERPVISKCTHAEYSSHGCPQRGTSIALTRSCVRLIDNGTLLSGSEVVPGRSLHNVIQSIR
jgi:hypothetical protein